MGNMQTGEAPVSSSAALAAGWAALPPEYAIPAAAPSLAESQAYCRRLATSHYENFSVVTWFLPKRLHRHFYSLYAYCRISDDLGDEVGNTEQSLLLLDAWEDELNATYESLGEPVAPGSCPAGSCSEAGNGQRATENGQRGTANGKREPRHPVFIALREAIRECQIPREPLADLLKAFRQDQTVQRYETFDDLRGYCRYSADPVGRLVLYLCGYRDPELQQLSDYTCTALQLANFWQDVSVDYGKGRIYLPLEDMRRFGVAESDIAQRRATPQFRELMRFEVERAREWFERGLPLISRLDKELAVDIELFSRGGQEILNAIERRNYDVLSARPSIPKSRKLWLVARAALRAKLTR
jgi:squalene synthase HpnC